MKTALNLKQQSSKKMKISLLLGSGVSGHYELGLLSGLVPRTPGIEIIGTDDIRHSPLLSSRNVRFYNFFGTRSENQGTAQKIRNIAAYYTRLIQYAITTDSRLFHVQWINKFAVFDRTALILLYKAIGKKVIFTAHNVDAGERDGNSTLLDRLSLKFLYGAVDHIIVHTEKMKSQLMKDFGTREAKISVIPHGILHVEAAGSITREQARKKLGLEPKERVILFFGNIAPYKGLEYLVQAAGILKERAQEFKIVIAGEVKKNNAPYWNEVTAAMAKRKLGDRLILKPELVPEADIEMYFKSADVLVLPYRHIFQTGVLFLAYNFGLPVIATDVGSIREDIVQGKTGYVCRPEDPLDLADRIEQYFGSDLFRNLEKNREIIISYAEQKYSWDAIGEKTDRLYRKILN